MRMTAGLWFAVVGEVVLLSHAVAAVGRQTEPEHPPLLVAAAEASRLLAVAVLTVQPPWTAVLRR